MELRRALVLFATAGCLLLYGQEQKYVELGDFKVESGEVIRHCRVGYRTFGTRDADGTNIIVFPTWAGGTTEQLAGSIGAGRSLGLAGYYVVAMDALANGVSSSPSNSAHQPRMQFPRITIRDMVESQHEALTRLLHITHVKAVMGISMGGMQTFQWIVQYPEFMDQAIAIAGSPRLAAYDLMDWQAQIDSVKNSPGWNEGNYTESPSRVADAEFGALMLTTPDHYNAQTTREQVKAAIEKARRGDGGQDANNKIRQCEAMMSMDVTDRFGGSMEKAAAAVRAKTLVIVTATDHVVTPGPAIDFAHLLGAQLLVLANNCGHLGANCAEAEVRDKIRAFLQ